MNNQLSNKEKRHLANIRELPCSVCDTPGPSEAHHIKQGQQYTAIALCVECHRGPSMGWHGGRIAWRVRKMDELAALNVTLKRLLNL